MPNTDSSEAYVYGCLMLDLRITGWDALIGALPEAQLYRPDEAMYGRQPNPHVTVLYGFHHSPGLGEELLTQLPIDLPALGKDLRVTGCDCFANPTYDVLKLTLRSTELDRLNRWCRNRYAYSSDYPDYRPHATLAYLQPGTGAAYRTANTYQGAAGLVSLTYSCPGQGQRRLTRAL